MRYFKFEFSYMQTVRREEDSIEVNIDISELNLQHSSIIEQVLIGNYPKLVMSVVLNIV